MKDKSIKSDPNAALATELREGWIEQHQALKKVIDDARAAGEDAAKVPWNDPGTWKA